jgi:hypothetical protein
MKTQKAELEKYIKGIEAGVAQQEVPECVSPENGTYAPNEGVEDVEESEVTNPFV